MEYLVVSTFVLLSTCYWVAKGKSQKGRGWDARRENTRRNNRKDLGDKEQKTQHQPESFSLSTQVQDVKLPPSTIKPSELIVPGNA